MDFSKLLYVFVKIDIRKSNLLHGYLKNYTWISQSCYMIQGFLLVVIWICQSCYVDLSNLLRGFVKVVLCICCLLAFAKQNQTEV